MQGYVPEYDTRFIIDPQFVKIAASSYLYKTAEKLGVKAYKCIGAVNFDHFYPVKVERKNFALYNPLKNGKIIEEMCGRLGLEIKPLFNIKQEYLKYIYSCATMYIAAEFESSGWSNPTAEAMACKCPIISTVTGSVGDLVIEGETGLYFGLDNFESFKNSINLVTDQTQREKMVEKAFLHVKQFSWDKLVQKLDFIIQLELNKDFNQESILWQQNL